MFLFLHDVLRRRLLERVGLVGQLNQPMRSLAWVYKTQWSPLFERYMRNRLVMGYFRYGSLRNKARRGTHYDSVGSAIRRLKAYLKTGNQEYLVDAANLCMVEFMVPSCHPSPEWRPADDGEHTRRV